MKNNPFLSDTFTTIWLKHFYNKKIPSFFNFIEGLSFIKPTLLPIYLNIGKNYTKGISYSLSSGQEPDFKNKVFLIYDVPTFFELDLNYNKKKLKQIKLKQYPGFLIDLESYTDFSHYFTSTFSKSSRYKLMKYKKRLESCFDISYHMYHGPMDREVYDHIFGCFKNLLEKRFLDKGISNNNLNPKEWNFYYEVAYPMILEKKASLFVIRNGDVPIGITLNYFSDNIVFDAITVFDIDYEKFHLGSVTIMKLIEWTLDQGLRYFDFSKGYFDYKKRWANKEYDFEYHLYYDSGSISSLLLSYLIILYFNLKNYLRKKKLNEAFHKFTFFLQRSGKDRNHDHRVFTYEEIDRPNNSQLTPIDYEDKQIGHLKNMVFDFLYLSGEAQKDVRVYEMTDTPSCYYISGKKNSQKVIIS
jgi:hypothetical protein